MFVGSRLWIQEAKNRMILTAVFEKEKNDFATMELMVMIAEVLKMDCCMIFNMSKDFKAPDLRAPYVWAESEEEYDGRKAKVYTMKAEDILNNLRPICMEKLRFSDEKVVEILQKEDPEVGEMELVINVASRYVDPVARYVPLDPEKILLNKRKFSAAQVVLYSKYFKERPMHFPPNPGHGDAILKSDLNGKDYLMEWYDDQEKTGWYRKEMPVAEMEVVK